jgi:pimeloyl-ACP methyl ester carboxylesterase
MIDPARSRPDRPVVFCLHYLGGSAREWTRVTALVERAECIALDLPGFGDAAATPGYTVADMADSIAGAIRARAPKRFTIAGHSMGAKVAAVLARRAEDGAPELAGLEGLVLVAGSPPSPEPIPDDRRQKMLVMFDGDADANGADARGYVAQNSGPKLDAAWTASAVTDALRMNRDAWTAWLARGSREDWSDRVGVLRTRTLIIAGDGDEDLGPSAQRDVMVPHFENVRVLSLAGAKHLLPMECSSDVARAIDEHVAFASYRALIASNRVGDETRRALRERGRPDDPAYRPAAMSSEALATFRAMIARVIPQPGPVQIDIAARIDAQLAAGEGDGWRFAVLPPDSEAYRAGLATLAERAFVDLDDDGQDDLLARIANGRYGDADGAAPPSSPGHLNAAQMRAWFEDVRAEAVKAYLGHPDTLARIGYSGIANGGDGQPKTGFARVGLGERETWEPHALPDGLR